MPNYWVQAWSLSDFTGPLAADATGTNGNGLVGTSTTLDAGATRTTFLISDDDANLDDMYLESGAVNSLAGPLTIDGVTYPSGSSVEAEYYLITDDLPPAILVVGRIGDGTSNSGENLVVFSPGNQIVPGRTYTFTSNHDDAQVPYNTICFASGTLIETDQGPVPVEGIAPGCLVRNMDGEFMPVRWAGHRHFSAAQLTLNPHLRPVTIKAGALGKNQPSQDLTVSPQHRVFLSDWRAELLFGGTSFLVPAIGLCNDQTIRQELPDTGVTYHHLLFDQHEVIRANGQWAESLFPGPHTLSTLTEDQLAELFSIFPELGDGQSPQETARKVLKPWEYRVLNAY